MDQLFSRLDQDGDGRLSLSDLQAGARDWGWREAPLYAVLHRLIIDGPLTKARFDYLVGLIAADPWGVYGEVLRVAQTPRHHFATGADGARTAILVIDPQRSFTEGAWKRSFGPGGDSEVEPIRRAFEACGRMLRQLEDRGSEVAVMFTRCAFPSESYGWDRRFDGVIDERQPYFVKPGNSALWPPTNGCGEWIAALLDRGCRSLAIAGCTLNSCVRVTAVEIAQRFAARGLTVSVDGSLCGARATNYLPSPTFGGRSPVEAALEQMAAAGVTCMDSWQDRRGEGP